MFNRENQHDVFDLFQKYPLAYGYKPLIAHMHTEILAAFAEAAANAPDFDDIGDLVYASSRSKDVVPRKCAWISTQVIGSGQARAIAVNQRILQRKASRRPGENGKMYVSPLVAALNCYGIVSELGWSEQVDRKLDPYICKESCTVDVLMFDATTTKAYVINAIGASQLQRINKSLLLGNAIPNLYAPTDRPLGNAYVPRRLARLTQLAAKAIRLACPDIEVIPLIMVVDEEQCSWFFQANRLPIEPVCAEERVCLDEFPIEESILSFVGGTGRMDVDLDKIPVHPPDNYLHALPVDRAIRPLMFLDRMVAEFESNMRDLTIWRASELHNVVRQHFNIAFARDIGRHDLEDCLRQSGWIQSPPFDRSRFYLAASGLALSRFVRQRFSQEGINLGPSVIHDMQRLVELEIAYRSKMSR